MSLWGKRSVVRKQQKEKPLAGLGCFCYEVFPTLGWFYAANANVESFAFTCFASATGFPQS